MCFDSSNAGIVGNDSKEVSNLLNSYISLDLKKSKLKEMKNLSEFERAKLFYNSYKNNNLSK